MNEFQESTAELKRRMMAVVDAMLSPIAELLAPLADKIAEITNRIATEDDDDSEEPK
jgi:1,2-phenylacetyl-CoA epoxidase catalytic subunit